jgi:hypothetical protein
MVRQMAHAVSLHISHDDLETWGSGHGYKEEGEETRFNQAV